MQMILTAMLGVMVLVMTTGCQSEDSQPNDLPVTPPPVPTDARQVQPLREGQKAATAVLRRVNGQKVDMATLYNRKPTVLIFYRGGWCPYCNTHLVQIAEAEPKLLAMGYQVLAISPDKPEEMAKTLGKHQLGYQLLSDSDLTFSRAFGLVFSVDDSTLEKYRGYGIDLEKSSGLDHHMLPVPAVYIVDNSGMIRFAHWDSDYKKRLEPDALLEAARKIN